MQGKKAKHLAYSLEIMGIFIYTDKYGKQESL